MIQNFTSQKFSQAFFNQSLCGFIYAEEGGDIIELNDCIADWLGFEICDLAGKNIAEFVSAGSADSFTSCLLQAKAMRKTEPSIFSLKRCDGRLLTVVAELTVVYTDEVVDHLIITLIKAAQQCQGENDLAQNDRSQHQWFQTIFNDSPIPLVVSNLENGNLEMVNTALLNVTGLKEAALIGKPSLDFYGDKHNKELIVKALLEKGVYSMELLFTFKNEKIDCLITSKILNDGQKKKMLTSLINITERKNAENELRSKQQQLLLTHKVAKVCDWRYFLKEDKFSFSDEVYEIFDIEKESFIHTISGLLSLIHPEDKNLLQKNRENAYSGKTDFNVDHRIIVKDGTTRWINAQAIVEYDNKGRASGLIGVSQDITERKNREQEIANLNGELEIKIKHRTKDLQRTQEMLFEAERMAKIGSWELDISTNTFSWSPEMYSITKFPPTRKPVDEYSKCFLPEEWEQLQQKIHRAVAFSESYEMELTIKRADGSGGFVATKGQPVKNSDDKVEKLIGTLADITEGKEAQHLLASQAEAFHAILEQSMAGYWDWKIDEEVLYLSPAFKAMFGYAIDELPDTRKSLYSIVYTEDLDFMLNLLAQHIESKGAVPYCGEVRFKHKDGHCIWVISRGAVIEWTKEGKPLRMVGCHIDITQQKTTEFNLKKSRRELEAFSYSVSHDLRAPVRGIDGWSLALLEDFGDSLSEGARNFIERVREETGRMNNLIDGMLKLSQLNSAKLELIQVSLSELAENIAARAMENYNSCRKFDFIIAARLKAFGDAALIEIVMNNLFENAIKFTAKKEIAIIQLGCQVIDGRQTFFIKDNGVGFDIDAAKNLFGAFQRMHSKKDFEGTGIGLATVQRIINLHGGNIWADAVVGEGATFYFYF